ncbi:MAG: N-acetyltransferase [Candidatus Omnitrophota bacterium]|nr:MAG: N-acetyltransferase [Candidatus Omnitrophota bacterium]
MILRKPNLCDAVSIYKLINLYSQTGKILARPLSDIYESLRDFVVCEYDGEIRGCCALHITWEFLAEIRSLVVTQDYQGRGIATSMVNYCLKEAIDLKVGKVFLLTEIPDFFKKLKFVIVDKSTLPHKIWRDCIQCVHFPDCNETALIKEIKV